MKARAPTRQALEARQDCQEVERTESAGSHRLFKLVTDFPPMSNNDIAAMHHAAPSMNVDAFVRSLAVSSNKPVCFLLGAGASMTSGMPSAQRCIWEWKRDIFVTNNPSLRAEVSEMSLAGTRAVIQGWIDRQGRFPAADTNEEYSALAKECYPTIAGRRDFFHAYIAKSKPHVGYRLLAQLGGAGLVRTIWTTNFDNMPTRALHAENVVCVEVGLDSTGRARIPQATDSVRVVYLHGDFRYDDLKNTAEELQRQDATLLSEFIHELKDYDLVVIGYSGRDKSLMEALTSAYANGNGCRLFWCGFGSKPNPEVSQLLLSVDPKRETAFYVPTEGFDDVLTRLALRRLDGNALERAKATIASFAPDAPRAMAFSTPPLPVTSLIKSNAFPLTCPTSALRLDLSMPETGNWRIWLQARLSSSMGASVVFERGALALVDAALAGEVFRHDLRAAPVSVQISAEDLLSNRKVLSLYRRALIKAAADALKVETDYQHRIWEPTFYREQTAGDETYHVHRAVSFRIVNLNGKAHVALMPEIVAKTKSGGLAAHDVQKAVRVAIYGYQHNNVFNEDLRHWVSKLTNIELLTPFGGSFRIGAVPVFAGLSQRGKSALPREKLKYVAQSGLIVNDANLVFRQKMSNAEARDANPLHGIVANRPWDYSLTTSGLRATTETAVICPPQAAPRLERFLRELQESAKPNHSERDYLHDFPGYASALGLPLTTPNRRDSTWLSLDDSVSADAMLGAKQLAQRICDGLDLLRRAKPGNIVVVYVPNHWLPYEAPVAGQESFNLHDYIKAYAARHGQATQFIREKTAINPQHCRVRWWVSLALYVKAMRTPWRLEAIDDNTAFVGIGYSIDSNADAGSHVLLGCSHLYSARGEGLQFRLGRIENPIMRGRNPFMSVDDARRTGETIRQLFYESKMHLPKRVVVHKRTGFTDEEQKGFAQGLEGVDNVELIEVNVEESLRYLAATYRDGRFNIDGFPVFRGTTVVESDNTALLWVHGSTPSMANRSWKYYQGKRRIPAPLRIRRYLGQSDVMQCASEILGLSKMNWNTFDHYSQMPATLDSASDIARLGMYLDGFGSAPYDYRLLI